MTFAFEDDPGVRVLRDAVLADFTTFRIGGPCSVLVDCSEPDGLIRVVRELHERNTHFILIGDGSNILVADEGYPGVILRYVKPDFASKVSEGLVSVSASCRLDDLVADLVNQGRGGLTFSSGIPGTIGGAITGNAGAWGKQMADVLESVTLLKRNGETCEVAPDKLGFAYRRSALQKAEDLVLSAVFRTSSTDPEALAKERANILETRAAKHPDLEKEPCIGSFFKNIEPTSAAERRQAAGAYLDEAGAKEMQVGGARVFSKHANIIINPGGATANDVAQLSEMMAAAVKERFGLVLEREVRFLGAVGPHDVVTPGFH